MHSLGLSSGSQPRRQRRPLSDTVLSLEFETVLKKIEIKSISKVFFFLKKKGN
jgi:hypothetical protein